MVACALTPFMTPVWIHFNELSFIEFDKRLLIGIWIAAPILWSTFLYRCPQCGETLTTYDSRGPGISLSTCVCSSCGVRLVGRSPGRSRGHSLERRPIGR